MRIDENKIFDATNGGLEIIFHYYPDANPKRNFKIRDEKTASASLKQNREDGRWLVTDFGGDQKPKNAIAICMLEENLEYYPALKLLATRYGVASEDGEIFKLEPKNKWLPVEENQSGKHFQTKDFSDAELKVLGRFVTQETCVKYGVHAVEYIDHFDTTTKDGTKYLRMFSTEHYPIFIIKRKEFTKILQPLSADKSHRFRYYGNKPKDHIYGIGHLKQEHQKLNNDNEDSDEKPEEKKLDEVVMCSGDRDALNIASLGFPVIWRNSETKTLSNYDFKKVKKLAEVIYNIPDLDETGIEAGLADANNNIELRTLWLPKHITLKKDFRGNYYKDVRDWINHFHRFDSEKSWITRFKNHLSQAKPLKFWETQYTKNGTKQILRTNLFLNFLEKNGFSRYESKEEKTEYIYIQQIKNTVHKIGLERIPATSKGFVLNWLKKNFAPLEVQELIINATKFTDSTLNALPKRKVNFKSYGKDFQYFFFENQDWKVTQNGIEVIKKEDTRVNVWEQDVLKHKVALEKDYFNISKVDDKNWHININRQDIEILNYLINGSRVFWREELEQPFKNNQEAKEEYHKKNLFRIDGENLNAEQIQEQKNHLVNKIYSIGYLLHQYKFSSNAYCVFAMDYRMSEDGQSYGRSGKSLLYNVLIPYLTRHEFVNATKKNLENEYIYGSITEDTNYVIFDDAYKGFRIRNHLFTEITADWSVNPKNRQQYVIPFTDSPKIAISSNFTPGDSDGSTLDRILHCVFSDYYHVTTADADYTETRKVPDEFGGKEFINHWGEEEFNRYINFMMQCLKFYLGNRAKIDAPLGRRLKRNLLEVMSQEFKEWADINLTAVLGTEWEKAEYHKSCERDLNWTKLTSNSFTKRLKAWCKFYGHELDPIDTCTDQKQRRIIRNINGKSLQKHFIRSNETLQVFTEGATVPTKTNTNDNDLPF